MHLDAYVADGEIAVSFVNVHEGVAHANVRHVRIHADVRRRTLEP